MSPELPGSGQRSGVGVAEQVGGVGGWCVPGGRLDLWQNGRVDLIAEEVPFAFDQPTGPVGVQDRLEEPAQLLRETVQVDV